MPRFHVVKAKVVYDGQPYQGPSGQACGYLGPLAFEDAQAARRATYHLQSYNPVGWKVMDSATNDCVHLEVA